MTRRRTAIDSHDVGALRGVGRRTLLLRLVLAAAAVAALAATIAEARRLETEKRTIVPTGSTAVLVVDLSLSIAEGQYVDVRRALRTILAADAPVGLVVFSDVPYELLPPGTPARELRPVLRALEPARRGPAANPWTQTFRAGTRISEALDLAATMLERERVARGSILLLSDLQTAPDDIAALATTIRGLRDRAVIVRVLPVGALSDGRLLFGRLLGADAFIEPSELRATAAGPTRSEQIATLPTALLVFAGLMFVALAAHERVGARLALERHVG